MMSLFNLFGASFTLVMSLMVGAWLIYLFKNKASVVDIAWGLAFIVTSWAYLYLGPGNFSKMLVLTIMVTIWAARLSYHILQRYRHRTEDDPRYLDLLEKWDPDSARFYFLMLFIFQGVLAVLLSLPFLIVALNSIEPWNRYELFGIVIWAIGVAGETIADRQLSSFLAEESNRGNVCREGFWYFSRHPNYFFEAVVWVGFSVFALGTDWGSLGLLSPVLMVALLTKVSGIPLSEAHSLRTKGEAYREYQRTTNAFIPWFPSLRSKP